MFRAGYGLNFKRSVQLLAGDAVAPIQELIHGAAMIEMVKKSLRWNSRPSENQGSAHHLRVLREHIEKAGDFVHIDSMPSNDFRVNYWI